MKYLPSVFTATAVVLAGIFAALNSVWTGFAYFVLSILFVLAVFWGVWLIFCYFTSFKDELNEHYKLFRADKISKSSSEFVEQNERALKKDFNKHVLKDKIVKWLIILFCFAVAATFLIAIIWYK